MHIPEKSFPDNLQGYGRNAHFVQSMEIQGNHIIDKYIYDQGKPVVNILSDSKGNPIEVNPKDCEWLSPTFFRNEDELYGFTLIEKSASTKRYLTKFRGEIDFESFQSMGENFAKDKNRYYYGPGAKIIKEEHLELFYDDTYEDEWYKLNPDKLWQRELNKWSTPVAAAGDKIYWKGRLAKGVHSSLQRITRYFFKDDYNLYYYDLQNIKKIDGVDMDSLVYMNQIRDNSVNGIVSDLYMPVYKYLMENKELTKYDYKDAAPLFQSMRDTLSPDYWWYKMEKSGNFKL